MVAVGVTPQQVQQLRDFIDEQENIAPYDDDALAAKILAAGGNVGAVAYYIWTAKAAGYSTLVDIQEGGSQRRNSQAYVAAKGMMESFQAYVPADPVNTGGRRSRTRAIVRP